MIQFIKVSFTLSYFLSIVTQYYYYLIKFFIIDLNLNFYFIIKERQICFHCFKALNQITKSLIYPNNFQTI